MGRQSQLWVEIGAVCNGSCKLQSCQKQKDNYSTDYESTRRRPFLIFDLYLFDLYPNWSFD